MNNFLLSIRFWFYWGTFCQVRDSRQIIRGRESCEYSSCLKASWPSRLLLDTKLECLHLSQSGEPCSSRLYSSWPVWPPCIYQSAEASRWPGGSRQSPVRLTLGIESEVGTFSWGRWRRLLDTSVVSRKLQSHSYQACWVSQPVHDWSRRWLDMEIRRKYFRKPWYPWSNRDETAPNRKRER